jgi:hypothetical protein
MSFEGFLLFLLLKKRNGREMNLAHNRLIVNMLQIQISSTLRITQWINDSKSLDKYTTIDNSTQHKVI